MPEPVDEPELSPVTQRTEAAARVLRGPVAGQYGGEPISRNGHTAFDYRPPQEPRRTAERPWVSVVVPNYNRVEMLKYAIDSVLHQDYPNIECIVVDAGSTDGSIELLKSYGEKIRWVSRPDRGAFDAINDGWKMGKGEILAWVNSDDVWEDGAASFAVRYFQEHPDIDVLYGACGAIDENGRLLEEYPPRPWDLRFALENCDHIINQTASFIRREMIEKVDYLYPAWCHDHDLWLRIAAKGGKFGTTPRRLGSARIWPDNLGNNPKVIVPGKVGLTKRFFETQDLPRSLRKMRRRAISNSYLRCLYYISPTQPKNWLVGAQLMLKATAADPANLPYLAGQVGGMLLRHTPVPTVARGVRAIVSVVGKLVTWPVRALASATVRTVRFIRPVTLMRVVGPIGAVAAAGALAITADVPPIEAAQVFALVALPLLATLAFWELVSRRTEG